MEFAMIVMISTGEIDGERPTPKDKGLRNGQQKSAGTTNNKLALSVFSCSCEGEETDRDVSA